MNEITLLRESGPEAPPLGPDVRSAARAALLAEIEGPVARRRRRPSRRLVLRIGAAVTAVAAAGAVAVLVAPPGGTDDVRLVGFRTPAFPLSLDHVPAGLTPAFSSGSDTSHLVADYRPVSGSDSFSVAVSADEPDWIEDEHRTWDARRTDEATVDGADVEVVRGRHDVPCEDGLSVCGSIAVAEVVWERRNGQWVALRGEGAYGHTADLLAVARSLVDRPQPVTLEVGLAPAGWSVAMFKDGRILVLTDDAHPDQQLSVHVPLPDDVVPPDQLLTQLMGPVGPVLPVTVHGLPAQLVRIDAGGRDTGWYLQALFPDGTTFVVQTPASFSRDQVVRFAEQVTHNP